MHSFISNILFNKSYQKANFIGLLFFKPPQAKIIPLKFMEENPNYGNYSEIGLFTFEIFFASS